MYIYLDKQGVVKEMINDEALRQSASNVNEIYVYYEGLQEADIGSVLATYGLPDGTITDEMQVATQTQESEIPYNAERDLKFFQYYKAYAFYHFAIADLALSQEGVVRLMIRLAQKDGEYIKVAGLICFDVEGELVKEDHGVSLAQYNYLVKAWVNANGFLPLDGSKAMQGNLDMGAHNVILNGKTLKDNNGALNYNGSDLAKQSDTSSLQSQIDTINATQNVVDIVGTKAELNDYATNNLHANDKIEVLADESQSNANTIYEWNGNAWSLVGSKAPYYSKSESDTRYNELKAKSYDKDTTEYVAGHVPDSGLVKKSLDGISENLETTKIQVSTNKTNIASNTQNIENLSAVMPTGINVDANGYAILEHDGAEITGQTKKVKFAQIDKSVSFSEVTIPTASALKAKDGTTIGGYNTQRIDVTTLLSQNDILSLIGALTGHLDNPSFTFDFTFTNNINNPTANEIDLYLDLSAFGETGFFDLFFVKGSNQDGLKYVSVYTSYSGNIIRYGGMSLTGSNNTLTKIYGGAIACADYATKIDLNAKQSTLYRHTVKISKPTDDGNTSITFTTSSVNNTPINSIQNLTTVFGNTDLSVSGATYLISSSQWEFYNKIHVGTSINDTTVDYINKDDVGTYNFIDMFGTTGFTITDNVTPM